jgi:putrescine transport system ATP-binding protein
MLLQARELEKSYGSDQVFSGVALSLGARETLAVLGRSGCGKTTLLKILAGLLRPDRGMIELGGVDVTDEPPERRGMIYLYQDPLLFPHLDVSENLAFGLRIRRRPEGEIGAAVERVLGELDLTGHARKKPDELSGGQRQRVASGRALVVEPALLLLDEPFSALDPETRASMQQLLRRVAAAHGLAAIFVTHSVKEALIVGDRLALMEGGRLSEYAAKADFVADPASGVGREIEFWQGIRGGPGGRGAGDS